MATVVGGEDNGCLWKKDGMVGVEGVVAPFCFPVFGTVHSGSESMCISIEGKGAENVGQELALALSLG